MFILSEHLVTQPLNQSERYFHYVMCSILHRTFNGLYVLSNSVVIGWFDYYDYNFYVRFPLLDGLMFIVVKRVYHRPYPNTCMYHRPCSCVINDRPGVVYRKDLSKCCLLKASLRQMIDSLDKSFLSTVFFIYKHVLIWPWSGLNINRCLSRHVGAMFLNFTLVLREVEIWNIVRLNWIITDSQKHSFILTPIVCCHRKEQRIIFLTARLGNKFVSLV
jgi:hypothetical protein